MPSKKQIRRVAVLSTHATNGGAAQAAFRHHTALRSIGIESTMITLQPLDNDTVSDGLESLSTTSPFDDERNQLRALINRTAIATNRTSLSQSWFSWPLHGEPLADHPAVRDADALSIHWVSGLLSMNQLESLFTLGIPILFTLHDEWLFTGGCHYTAGCGGFRTDCTRCPQLVQDPIGVTAKVLQRRISLGTDACGTVVSPSRWLCDQSKQSSTFASWDHQVIPYACNLDTFSPRNTAQTRKRLDLDQDRIWLMFIADNLGDERKGFSVLREAILFSNNASQRFGIVLVGAGVVPGDIAGVEIRTVGETKQSQMLADIYASCDALILPSLEDNLPNTMIESLACGTPVIGSDVGGIPDFVIPNKTGLLFEPGNAKALASVLDSIDIKSLQSFRTACRQLAESSFSQKAHAQRWIEVASSTPITDSFDPKPDAPLLDAACSLAEYRATRISSTAKLSKANDLIHSYEHKIDEIALKLRDSERDRADRLMHIYELNEIISKLTTQQADLKQHACGIADRVESAILHSQTALSESHSSFSEQLQAQINSAVDAINTNITAIQTAQQEFNTRLSDQAATIQSLDAQRLANAQRADEAEALSEKMQSDLSQRLYVQGATIQSLDAQRLANAQRADEAEALSDMLRSDLHKNLDQLKKLDAALCELRTEHNELKIYIERTIIARVKRKLNQLLYLNTSSDESSPK